MQPNPGILFSRRFIEVLPEEVRGSLDIFTLLYFHQSASLMADYADGESSWDSGDDVGGSSKSGLCLEPSSGAGCSNPVRENTASSSHSHFRQGFVDMGFLPALVDKVLEENGEENADLVLETLIAYSDVKKSSHGSSDSLDEIFSDVKDGSTYAEFAIDGPEVKDVKNSSPGSSDSLDEVFGDCTGGTAAKLDTNGVEFKELDAACKVHEDRRESLLMMNFSVEEVDFALDKFGEDAPISEIVDFIVAAQVARGSGVDINDQSPANRENIEDNGTESLFCTMDVTLRLLEMGFTENEISSAIEKYGAEIPIEELADSIVASHVADTCFVKDEDPPVHRMNHSHRENYGTSLGSQEEHSRRRSFDTLIAETEASSSRAFLHADDVDFYGKRPKLEYEDYSDASIYGFSSPESKPFEPKPTSVSANLPSDAFLGSFSPEAKSFKHNSTSFSTSLPHKDVHKSGKCLNRDIFPPQFETNSSGGIRQMVANRPYFFYGNVLDVSHETWKKLSQFLFAFDPEFANTQFFSALSRKEGYIHNLPKDDRSHILPRPPMTIEDAMPHTKKWWPSWDTRKQLSCINSDMKGISQLCERLGNILITSQGMLSSEQQTDILHHCKSLNLVWVGQYKLNPIDPEQVERIFGYPLRHTLSVVLDPVESLRLLKHSFQTDTLGYHLSALKWIFPDGVTVLSIYSGIGGAEIAIHRLGIQLKGVVSVESSETNRRIIKRWWQNTQQTGKLIQIESVNRLTSTKVKTLIDDLGGFDLVICQNPFTHIPGSSTVNLNRENPEGFDFNSFFEFVRVLTSVRSAMGSR